MKDYTAVRDIILSKWHEDPSTHLYAGACHHDAVCMDLLREAHELLEKQGVINYGVLKDVPLPAYGEDSAVTRAVVEQLVVGIVRGADLDGLSLKSVRDRVQSRLGVSKERMLEFKSFIADVVDAQLKADRPSGKVVVIGAGPAGLSAATHLERQGVTVVLLEARDRVGGRVHSYKGDFSAPVDLGASLITGATPDGLNHVRAEPSAVLCRQLGIRLHELDRQLLPLYDCATGLEIPCPGPVDSAVSELWNALLDEQRLEAEATADGPGPGRSMGDMLERLLKRRMAEGGGAAGPDGEDAPAPANSEAARPDGEAAPAPTKSEAAEPNSEDAPAPTKSEAAQPNSEDAPAPTDSEAARPDGEDAPAPTTSEAAQPNGEDAPAPTNSEAARLDGEDAPAPSGGGGAAVLGQERVGGMSREDCELAAGGGDMPTSSGAHPPPPEGAAEPLQPGSDAPCPTPASGPPPGRPPAALTHTSCPAPSGSSEARPPSPPPPASDAPPAVKREEADDAASRHPKEEAAHPHPARSPGREQAAAVTPEMARLLDWHVANLEYGCSSDLHEVSGTQAFQDENYGGFAGEHCMVVGGYDAILRAMADRLRDLRLRCPVSRVEYEGGGVRVTTAAGEVIPADLAIVTVPLGCLKHEDIAFQPPLPPAKLQAIRRLGYGHLNKVVLEFGTAFWRSDVDYFGHTGPETLLESGRCERGMCFYFWNLHRFCGAPMLTCLVSGSAAKASESMPAEEVMGCAMAALRNIYKDACTDPIRWHVTRWGKDPYARGSYSYVAQGASGEDYDALAAPVADRVLWAGEHTTKQHPDTAGGAFLTGLREAVRATALLQGSKDPLIVVEEHPQSGRAGKPSTDYVTARQEGGAGRASASQAGGGKRKVEGVHPPPGVKRARSNEDVGSVAVQVGVCAS